MPNNCAEGFENQNLLHFMLNENSIQRGAEWLLKMNFQRIKRLNYSNWDQWSLLCVIMHDLKQENTTEEIKLIDGVIDIVNILY